MPRMRKKTELPTRICRACGRPFAWRRKWARDWDRVLSCSDRCRAASGAAAAKGGGARAGGSHAGGA